MRIENYGKAPIVKCSLGLEVVKIIDVSRIYQYEIVDKLVRE